MSNVSKSNRRQAIRSIDSHFESEHVESCIKGKAFDVRVYNNHGEEICFFDSHSIQGPDVVGRFSDGSGEVSIPLH